MTTEKDISKLIDTKISQLTSETFQDDEEEKIMMRAIKKASKDLSLLLKSHTSPTAQRDALQQKYMDVFAEWKRLEKEWTRLKRKHDQQSKERDALKANLSRTSMQKQRIENLCRELQKQLHQVKEESRSVVEEIKLETRRVVQDARQESQRIVHEEQYKREQISSKFVSMVLEIKEKMQVEIQSKKRKEEEFKLLKEKFKYYMEQYDIREQHMQSVVQNKDLELSLLKTKLENTESKLEEQKKLVNKLKQDLEAAAYAEKQLMEQQSEWAEKFKHIEQEVKRYNPLVNSIKLEMERTNYRNNQLQEDNKSLRSSGERLVEKMLLIEEEKTLLEAKISKLASNNKKLDSLCRALQSDRQKLITRNKTIETRIRMHFGDLADPILTEDSLFDEMLQEYEEMTLNSQPVPGNTDANYHFVPKLSTSHPEHQHHVHSHTSINNSNIVNSNNITSEKNTSKNNNNNKNKNTKNTDTKKKLEIGKNVQQQPINSSEMNVIQQVLMDAEQLQVHHTEDETVSETNQSFSFPSSSYQHEPRLSNNNTSKSPPEQPNRIHYDPHHLLSMLDMGQQEHTHEGKPHQPDLFDSLQTTREELFEQIEEMYTQELLKQAHHRQQERIEQLDIWKSTSNHHHHHHHHFHEDEEKDDHEHILVLGEDGEIHNLEESDFVFNSHLNHLHVSKTCSSSSPHHHTHNHDENRSLSPSRLTIPIVPKPHSKKSSKNNKKKKNRK